jgi:hypothetical protein
LERDLIGVQKRLCLTFDAVSDSLGVSIEGINAMQQALRRSSLVPAGFVVESAFSSPPRR